MRSFFRCKYWLRLVFESLFYSIKIVGNIEWTDPSFNISRELGSDHGVILEIGGPTELYCENTVYSLLKECCNNHVLISNIEECDCYEDEEVSEPIDLFADGKKLPFKLQSIKAIFCSCLYRDERKEILAEIARVIQLGGLLVWRGCNKKNIEQAERLGFQIVQVENCFVLAHVFFCCLIFARESMIDTTNCITYKEVVGVVGSIYLETPYTVVFKKTS